MENVSLIVAGLPARGDAGDHFPVGVLIDQPFEQIARQLGLRQANRFDRIERGRFVFNVAHDFLFGRQRGARGTCAAMALLIQAPIAAAQSAKRKPRCIFLPVIMMFPVNHLNFYHIAQDPSGLALTAEKLQKWDSGDKTRAAQGGTGGVCSSDRQSYRWMLLMR